jgi:hypothetical protein
MVITFATISLCFITSQFLLQSENKNKISYIKIRFKIDKNRIGEQKNKLFRALKKHINVGFISR